jgi:hypothetical protein
MRADPEILHRLSAAQSLKGDTEPASLRWGIEYVQSMQVGDE